MYGLTVDRLLAVELVTPSGALVTANASHHADVFWSARGGGGGQFAGVATAFHFRLVDRPLFVTTFDYRYALSAEVLSHWQSQLLDHPNRRLTVDILRLRQWPFFDLHGVGIEMTESEVHDLMAPTRFLLGDPVTSYEYVRKEWLAVPDANNGSEHCRRAYLWQRWVEL